MMDIETEGRIKEENKKLHNFSANSYDNYPSYILQQQMEMYSEDIKLMKSYLKNKNCKVLDCGCGTGILANELIKQGITDIHCLDISNEMIKITMAKTNHSCHYFVGDIKLMKSYLKNKNCKVLDCGCGTGILANEFIKQGITDVHCLDISNEMIKIIMAKTNHSCHYFVGDIDIHFEVISHKYDIICFTSVLHHIGDYYKTLELAIGKLKKGGLIYIADEPQKGERSFSAICWGVQFVGNLCININRACKNPRHAINFIKNKFRNDKDNIDVELAEYHATRGGINDNVLLGYFIKQKFKMILYKVYLMNAFKFMDRLNFLYKDRPRTFSIIVRKK